MVWAYFYMIPKLWAGMKGVEDWGIKCIKGKARYKEKQIYT